MYMDIDLWCIESHPIILHAYINHESSNRMVHADPTY